ncbi:Interferon-induced guanylate-binding protein 1 [Myotis brandtii]|uniref:Interferon-induced guanylate-binding protein 1 n=1 Tax=Myotis brandtii TaxID=109478 RepID=S7MHW6_MYOBR|nr:Interferon-induced guanylate-binding protein 1 [Myotis brandtii]
MIGKPGAGKVAPWNRGAALPVARDHDRDCDRKARPQARRHPRTQEPPCLRTMIVIGKPGAGKVAPRDPGGHQRGLQPKQRSSYEGEGWGQKELQELFWPETEDCRRSEEQSLKAPATAKTVSRAKMKAVARVKIRDTLDMASDIHMPDPVCLIENTNTQLVVNPEALKILSAITQPVVVVAIVGLCHTGKSYLMNKLAGQKKGFSLGFMVEFYTKGIWMWCVRHPKKPNCTLVLLDTEGLGDVQKGDNQNDSWIFALAILLSSTFVYNSMGTINQQAMDQLQYPFCELEVDGQPISADEYLQNSLKLKPGTSHKDKNFNQPRLCIQKFFPMKKCFIFDQPTHWQKIGLLKTMHDYELDPKFVQQAADFCSYIFSNSKVKTLSGGIQVNGPRLETMVLTYVNAINKEDFSCMENAVLALAQIENSAAVEKAMTHYEQLIGEKVQLPEDFQEQQELFMASRKEAIEVFIKNSFNDVDHLFQRKLQAQIEERQDNIIQENQKKLLDYKSYINHIIKEDKNKVAYSKPGDYKLLFEAIVKLTEHLPGPYEDIPREEILQIYLRHRDSVMNEILQTDQNLTEKEKEIEGEEQVKRLDSLNSF